MRKKFHDFIIMSIWAIAAFALIIFITVTAPAHAHSWYDKECCNENDCAEVTNTVELPNGNLEVSSKFGTVLIDRKFPRRPSQDNKEHVCMLPNMHDGWEMVPSKYTHFPLCYYVPLGS